MKNGIENALVWGSPQTTRSVSEFNRLRLAGPMIKVNKVEICIADTETFPRVVHGLMRQPYHVPSPFMKLPSQTTRCPSEHGSCHLER